MPSPSSCGSFWPESRFDSSSNPPVRVPRMKGDGAPLGNNHPLRRQHRHTGRDRAAPKPQFGADKKVSPLRRQFAGFWQSVSPNILWLSPRSEASTGFHVLQLMGSWSTPACSTITIHHHYAFETTLDLVRPEHWPSISAPLTLLARRQEPLLTRNRPPRPIPHWHTGHCGGYD